MKLNIKKNRSVIKYSRKVMLARILWAAGRFIFRNTPRSCFGLRRSILRLYGAKVGADVNIYSSALIYYPWNLEIGADSSIGEWALIYNLGQVQIGERTTISQRAHLCAGSHDYRDSCMPLLKLPIQISDEVWVCADAFIGPGVSVKNRAIIAAASVVVKDVESSVIVGGNPAKLIKGRDE